MAKIKIFGDAMIITSAISTEVLGKLKKYKPAQLKLVDPETKNEVFAIGIGSNSSFSKYGIVFTGTDSDGKATVTLPLPTGLSNAQKKEFVRDNAGYGLLSLSELESAIQGAALELTNEFEMIDESIEIIGETADEQEGR